MRNTFDGRVIARVLEYMRTYQEYFGKLPILIRLKEYVDSMLRCIHSITITITNSLFRHMKFTTVFLLYNLAITCP